MKTSGKNKQRYQNYTDAYKYRILARASRTLFKGKSTLMLENTLERWIRQLHAPFEIHSYEVYPWGFDYCLRINRQKVDSTIKVDFVHIVIPM